MPTCYPVILVGAGPGDPGLLTVAGRRAIEEAQVVLYDRLVGDGVLALIPHSAERIDVGKRAGDHPVPQPQINQLLLDQAMTGKRVVRLKGGDPYLFGRGAEELDLLVRNGVPFQVIPGVTSAIAAPASVGIPVTHRQYASSVHIITGHGKNGTTPDIPFAALRDLKGTLIFLMGLATIDSLTDGLIQAGMDPDTPSALVENGTRPDRRRLDGTLGTIADVSRRDKATAPAILVVGHVCSLATQYDQSGIDSLAGCRILVVSSETTASRLADGLRERGASVTPVAAIQRTPLPVPDEIFQDIGDYGWIVLTSPYGSSLFLDELSRRRLDLRCLAGLRIAVVGPASGKPLTDKGIFPDLVADNPSSAGLAEALGKEVRPGDRVLLFRAAVADPILDDALLREGAVLTRVDAYRTTPRTNSWHEIARDLANHEYDAVTFTSASAVTAFVEAIPAASLPRDAFLTFCIGSMSAAAATAAGLDPLVPETASIESMISCMETRLEKI